MVHAPSIVALAAVAACLPAGSLGTAARDGAADLAGAGSPDALADRPEPPLAISPDEAARRLARLIWDDESAASAVPGLPVPVTREAVREIAGAMLVDPRARSGIAAFYRWWLQLDELAAIQKEPAPETLDDPLRQAMRAEAPALGVHLTLDQDGGFDELLLAPYTFANERLARHYGMTGVTGDEMRKVPFETERRIGVVSGAGVLTRFASLVDPVWPAKRGWLINDPLLCSIPIRTLLPAMALDPGRSIRQQMIDVTAEPSCVPCHEILNPPGFAFIGFDTYGRFRPEEADRPGENQGWIARQVLGDEPRFDSLRELMELLAGRDEARRCFVRQWLQFATNREGGAPPVEDEGLRPSVDRAYGSFAARGFRLRDVILGVVTSDAFLRP